MATNQSLTERFQRGLQTTYHAAVMVGGSLTVGSLLAGGLAPLLMGGVSLTVLAPWLKSMGGNALAGWLGQWAMQAMRPDQTEARLRAAMADSLSTQMQSNADLVQDLAVLIQHARHDQAVSAILMDYADLTAETTLRIETRVTHAAMVLQTLYTDIQQLRHETQTLGEQLLMQVSATQVALVQYAQQHDLMHNHRIQQLLVALHEADQASRMRAAGAASVARRNQAKALIQSGSGTAQPANYAEGNSVGGVIRQTYYGPPSASGTPPRTHPNVAEDNTIGEDMTQTWDDRGPTVAPTPHATVVVDSPWYCDESCFVTITMQHATGPYQVRWYWGATSGLLRSTIDTLSLTITPTTLGQTRLRIQIDDQEGQRIAEHQQVVTVFERS
ncbi:hypothetical protein Haur_2041 [Herpetosiphon aurantiacus DSM 785]|uniref:Uncharacterized protein n=1 Tax=Herpetosiphon aurantiacus (strain ATCC 23779 / DSM 785 / 114-95) TaxID=316274 RepID=A9AVJ3_HERA2|nr:hypothetical protein Haur_2041 [Herpetosiphon aurantiacus DSM 785]